MVLDATLHSSPPFSPSSVDSVRKISVCLSLPPLFFLILLPFLCTYPFQLPQVHHRLFPCISWWVFCLSSSDHSFCWRILGQNSPSPQFPHLFQPILSSTISTSSHAASSCSSCYYRVLWRLFTSIVILLPHFAPLTFRFIKVYSSLVCKQQSLIRLFNKKYCFYSYICYQQ